MHTYEIERNYWEHFYKNHFGWTIESHSMSIPPKPDYKCSLKVFPVQLTKSAVIAKARDLFPTRFAYSNLSKAIPENARSTKQQPYGIWVADAPEPSHFLGQSVLVSDPNKKIGTTFFEQTLIEIEYFLRTGEHMNQKGMTLCSGSRFDDDGVPGVRFNEEGYSLCWIALAQTHSLAGIRRVST